MRRVGSTPTASGPGVRVDLCAGCGQRHHHEFPVRHQLAGLHGNGGQHRRPAARLRGADGVLPRSRFPGCDAVRPRAGERAGAFPVDLLRRLRHHAECVLDPGAELVDADAHRPRDRRWCVPRQELVRRHLQPFVSVPADAHAAGVGADLRLPADGPVGMAAVARRGPALGPARASCGPHAGGRAHPGADLRRRSARPEHAAAPAGQDRRDGRCVEHRTRRAAAVVCLA